MLKLEIAWVIIETEGCRQVQLQKLTLSFLKLEASVLNLITTFVISSASTSARNRQGTLQTTPLSTIQPRPSSRECTPAAMDTSPSSMHGQTLLTEYSNGTQAAGDPGTFTPFADARFLLHLGLMLIPAVINLLMDRICLLKLTFLLSNGFDFNKFQTFSLEDETEMPNSAVAFCV